MKLVGMRIGVRWQNDTRTKTETQKTAKNTALSWNFRILNLWKRGKQMNIDLLLTIGMLVGFWSFVIFAYRWF